MTITTDRNREQQAVEWCWNPGIVDELRICIPFEMTAQEAIENYDGLNAVERFSEKEGNKVYEGYSRLTSFESANGCTKITLAKAKK